MKEIKEIKKGKEMKTAVCSFSSFLLFCLLCMLPSFSLAQSNNTNSPYTRYGYGQLADQSFAAQRGMGGIGYGLRNPRIINPLNPASFSAIDSMTFMMDFGLKGQAGWFKEGAKQVKKYNAGIEYLALQFPLAKGLGMGIGFEPVSYVGYQFVEDARQTAQKSYATYSGKGGLNKVYTTLSYRILDRFSLGANVGYLFGDLIHNKSILFNIEGTHTVSWSDTLRARGVTYEAGFQYVHPIGKSEEVVLGAVYTPKTRFGAKVMTGETNYDNNGVLTGTPRLSATKDSVFQLPETYAVGISYRKINKWTAGADVQYQRWAGAKFYDKTDTLFNRIKINVGAEYTRKLHYRAGAHYSDAYVKAKGSGYNEYGVSLGVGIPMIDKRSFLNLALEYSVLRPKVKELLDEQYLKFTLSYTFNELWFFKRKLQ
ncbi:MAG: outer membrane protein transport protein [Dysgonamonadaceae bacterium]|jgi:hypothetical protein|nr:outer membrane protein transport protein [Dysgonamonadaceae bacterium]